MSLRYVDSFDHYSAGEITQKWTALTGTVSVISGGNYNSAGQFLRVSRAQTYVTRTIDAQSAWHLGWALRISGPSPSGIPVVLAALLDAGTVQADLRLNADQTLEVTRAGTAVSGGKSTRPLVADLFQFVEWKCQLKSGISSDEVLVRVDGELFVSVTSGESLIITANATANQILLGNTLTTLPAAHDYDDLIVLDRQGALSALSGGMAVFTVYPSSGGQYSAFSPSSGANHVSQVNQVTPDGDATYVSNALVSTRESFFFASHTLASLTRVVAVQLDMNARKTNTEVKGLNLFTALSATIASGVTSQALPTAYRYFLEVFSANVGGSSWALSQVSTTEFGVLLTAG